MKQFEANPDYGENMQLKVYLDNVIICGRIRSDLSESENSAVHKLGAAPYAEMIEICTSRQSWEEQDRTANQDIRDSFREERDAIPVVSYDRELMGGALMPDLTGSFVQTRALTEIIDSLLYSDLKCIGLDEGDSKHFMYAFHNEANRFLTTDTDFIDRADKLEERCPTIRICTPSQMVAELDESLTGA